MAGRVWLNPPYGRSLTSAFATRAVAEYDAGRVAAAVLLLNAYGFDSAWFGLASRAASRICLTDHRIEFYGGAPMHGSVFAYLGPDPARFARVFARFGTTWARDAA